MNPSVSVVVASRGRPRELRRCLTALRQIYTPNVEVVVVADSASLPELEPVSGVKAVRFDTPNLSAARNAGIRAAGGGIVAFIDDDAVAEPTWLDHLIAPFSDARVAAAGGYVVGRNGFSLQWGAMCLDQSGLSHPLRLDGDAPQVMTTAPGQRAIRTHGTNMAVRRDVLARMGGFDEAFHWYHDDADLNLRLAQDGHLTAIVPRARVHHATAASDRRRSDRAPLSLYDIGASSAVFHRKHLGERDWAAAHEAVAARQRRRLTAMLIDGRVEPKRFEALARSLHAGYNDGLMRASAPAEIGAPPPFAPCDPPEAPRHVILAGGVLDLRALRSEARAAVASGAVVTVIALDPTARFHRLRYTDSGWWEHTGGQFGRADRDGPFFRRYSLRQRLEIEARRAAGSRTPPGAD